MMSKLVPRYKNIGQKHCRFSTNITNVDNNNNDNNFLPKHGTNIGYLILSARETLINYHDSRVAVSPIVNS